MRRRPVRDLLKVSGLGTALKIDRSRLEECKELPYSLKASEVNNGLDEDGVVADVGVLRVEFGERAEEGAAAGDVHVADRSLE